MGASIFDFHSMSAYEEHTLKEHPAHFITHLVFAPKTILGDELLQIIVMLQNQNSHLRNQQRRHPMSSTLMILTKE
jgi:hypothetical protein